MYSVCHNYLCRIIGRNRKTDMQIKTEVQIGTTIFRKIGKYFRTYGHGITS
jgi:hypothetical protein